MKQDIRFTDLIASSIHGLGFYFSDQVAKLHQNSALRAALSIENGGSPGGGCFVLHLP